MPNKLFRLIFALSILLSATKVFGEEADQSKPIKHVTNDIQTLKIEQINVITESWEGATNKDGSGLYFDLLRLVYSPLGINLTFKIAPYERAVHQVVSKTMDAWIASYENENDQVIYPEYHHDHDIVSVTFKKETFPDWSGQTSLTNKRLSWIRGYGYEQYLAVPSEWRESNNRQSALAMLKLERIDAFIDAKSEMKRAFKEAKLDPEIYGIEDLIRLKLFIAFAQTPKGRKLATIWDQRVQKLIRSGELKELWNKHNYSAYPFH